MRLGLRAAAIVMATAGAAACGACVNPTPRIRQQRPAAQQNWPAALSAAQRAADEGRYVDADRELVLFSKIHAGTPEAQESVFWRALYKLDPRNGAGGTSQVVTLVDTLLLARGTQPRRAEAVVVRRTALLLDSLRREAAERDTVIVRDTGRAMARERELEEQIKTLQDSLNATIAELERIRKRLAAPRP
jgi:hypothetical protein